MLSIDGVTKVMPSLLPYNKKGAALVMCRSFMIRVDRVLCNSFSILRYSFSVRKNSSAFVYFTRMVLPSEVM